MCSTTCSNIEQVMLQKGLYGQTLRLLLLGVPKASETFATGLTQTRQSSCLWD